MARRKRTVPALDPVMTVMADVLFQLLVYALITAAGGGLGSMSIDGDVELPPGGEGVVAAPGPRPHVTLTIDADKRILVDGEEVSGDELRRRVAQAVAGTEASFVLIRCDGRVDLKSLVELQTMLRDDLKVSKVDFAVTRREK